jgi:hypothetical protein
MRAPEPCYPSFTLALENMGIPRHQSLANTSILSEGSTITVDLHPRDRQDPLMVGHVATITVYEVDASP